jgi:hypothetical protein
MPVDDPPRRGGSCTVIFAALVRPEVIGADVPDDEFYEVYALDRYRRVNRCG